MKIRFFLVASLAIAVSVALVSHSTVLAQAQAQTQEQEQTQELGIGSKAPVLDIEHWIQLGNGYFEPVTKFEDGKVYVVEFWATWCGPCIASMPHLAELQNEYRGQGVQIISVSDEPLDVVKEFLEKENEKLDKTFEEITSAYTLTTDPDRSVHEDYMEAANQPGIPTAFIVGKTGLVEWIGHPGEMDEPLAQVVNDSWDREAFKAEMKAREELQEKMQQMSQLAGSGEFDKALELVNAQIAQAPNEAFREHWTAIRHSLKLSKGEVDPETVNFYREQIQEMKGDVQSLIRFGYSLYGVIQRGGEVGPLAKETVQALEAESGDVEDAVKPMYYNTIALLSDAAGNLEKAIEAQQAAVDAADERTAERLKPMLEDLKERAGKQDASESSEQDSK